MGKLPQTPYCVSPTPNPFSDTWKLHLVYVSILLVPWTLMIYEVLSQQRRLNEQRPVIRHNAGTQIDGMCTGKILPMSYLLQRCIVSNRPFNQMEHLPISKMVHQERQCRQYAWTVYIDIFFHGRTQEDFEFLGRYLEKPLGWMLLWSNGDGFHPEAVSAPGAAETTLKSSDTGPVFLPGHTHAL